MNILFIVLLLSYTAQSFERFETTIDLNKSSYWKKEKVSKKTSNKNPYKQDTSGLYRRSPVITVCKNLDPQKKRMNKEKNVAARIAKENEAKDPRIGRIIGDYRFMPKDMHQILYHKNLARPNCIPSYSPVSSNPSIILPYHEGIKEAVANGRKLANAEFEIVMRMSRSAINNSREAYKAL
jgi:hypothetical protein